MGAGEEVRDRSPQRDLEGARSEEQGIRRCRERGAKDRGTQRPRQAR